MLYAFRIFLEDTYIHFVFGGSTYVECCWETSFYRKFFSLVINCKIKMWMLEVHVYSEKFHSFTFRHLTFVSSSDIQFNFFVFSFITLKELNVIKSVTICDEISEIVLSMYSNLLDVDIHLLLNVLYCRIITYFS